MPESLPLFEEHPQHPINPYGRTKLVVEWMLRDFAEAYGLCAIAPCVISTLPERPRASLQAGIGEWHEPETHLIPPSAASG
jgi:UDP-glucose 4-epimerase